MSATIQQDDFEKVITHEDFDNLTTEIDRFNAALALIGEGEGRQLYCDDMLTTLQPIADGISMITGRAFDLGRKLIRKK